MLKLVNLTPHDVVIHDHEGNILTIKSGGGLESGELLPVARVDSTPGELLEVMPDGVKCYAAPQWGPVLNLPDPREGYAFIVSMIVAARVPGRKDVFSPGTGPKDGAIRENGQIKAVTRLIQA